MLLKETRRLYFALGDEVFHLCHPEWGMGTVVEEMNSNVSGGLSMIRVKFQNSDEKSFNNDIDSLHFCYHAGLRRY